MKIASSELILNPNGSIYHLGLKPEDVSSTIITVGDQARVDTIAARLDKILFDFQNREFKTVTGELGSSLITIISTGIGTDNIDIVLNELDALFNVDFESREVKEDLQVLKFIRIGTSGAIRKEIELDDFIVSKYAIGLEGLMHFYKTGERSLQINDLQADIKPYAFSSDDLLYDTFASIGNSGVTLTANGFYGPQSRGIRLAPKYDWIQLARQMTIGNQKVTNLEMETAGIYGLSKLMGHQAISLNAILANRVTQEFSSSPQKTISTLIDKSLELILNL